MKNKKFIVLISVLVAVIIFGVTAGVIFAQNSTDNSSTSSNSNPILTRVATILGIDEQKLEDAFQQAMKEERAQRMDDYLQKLVDEGKITSDQAAQYKTWLESKPDIQMPGHGMFPPPNRFMQQEGFPGNNGAPVPEMN
jgi:hypothetical protein